MAHLSEVLRILAVLRRGVYQWTLTAWDNEASMKTYMMADAHREAMPKLVE